MAIGELISFLSPNLQVVVLLLIVGIQKEDDVITTIQNLDTKTQRDIMYFDKSGIQKVDKGIFASGEERTLLAYIY